MASGRVRLPGPHLRHAAEMLKQGRNPAARVYESIGPDFFLAMAPGWLNLGLWEGAGSEEEAEDACRRLVGTLAAALPAGGVVVDVGNGLGTQDPLIAQSLHPRRLVAVNITEWQLAAGRDRLREAAAAPVVGDAVRLPVADAAVDGILSVEAAFHFRSRKAILRGVLPRAAARWGAEHVRYLGPAMAGHARRGDLGPDPAAALRDASQHGHDGAPDRGGRIRGRAH